MEEMEKEIMKTASLKKLAGENRYEQLKNLVETVDALDEDIWNGMSEEAQVWCNEATKAIKAGKPIADFGGGQVSPEAEKEEGKEKEAVSSASKGKDRKMRSTATAAKANGQQRKANGSAKLPPARRSTVKEKVSVRAAPRHHSAREGRGEGAPTIILREVIRNPKITAKEMVEKLTKRGSKVSPMTVSTILSRATSMLRMLNDEGHLKGLKV